jgi:hypothetical protein
MPVAIIYGGDGAGAFEEKLGQKTKALSLPVTLAADEDAVQTTGAKPATPAVTAVAASASSVTILASNADRMGATVYNDGVAILYLKLGATASATSFTIALGRYEYYEIPFGYTGVIDGIWTAATGSARVTELEA